MKQLLHNKRMDDKLRYIKAVGYWPGLLGTISIHMSSNKVLLLLLIWGQCMNP